MLKACSVLLFIGVLFFLGNVNAKGVHLEEVEVTHKCVHDQMPDEFKYPAKGLAPIDIPYVNHPLELAKNKQLLKKQSPNSGSPQIRFTFDSTRVATLGDAIGGTQRTCFSVGQTYIDQYNGSTLSCQSPDVLTTQYQTFLTTDLLPWLETTIEAAIRVTAVPSPGITVSSPTPCGTQSNAATVITPQTFANTDLHVIVTARPTQSGVAAFAGFCQADTYGRPLLGYINFGVRAWNLVDSYKVQELRMTALHELTHVLGFSGNYFPQMRDPSTGLTYVTAPVGTMANGKSGLQTPTVLAEAQAQFNCSTLDGGQIEDEGGAGTAGSHWERSQYEGEYMVGVAYSNAVFSRMTMAWMYDSGWYYPDFSKAQTLRWGFRRGCSFVNSCTSPSRTTDFWGCAPSPTSGGNDGCSWDRNAMGPCSASSLMNGCTYYTSYSNRQCRWASTVWNTPGKVGTNDSACFGSTLNDLANFGCYQWLCRNQNQFFIVLNGVNYYCPFGTTSDSTISVSSGSKVGNIKCPRVSEQWCYNAPSPAQNPDLFTVSSVSPSSGKSSTSITISGTNFTSTMTVTVCDSSCTNPTVNAAKTTITCAVSADGDATADKYCAVVVSDTSGNKAGGAFTLSSDSGINLDSASWTSCAIATAAYGSPMDENVWKLREFRDQYLKQTPLGQSFISFYYTHSPMVAEFIAHNDFLRLCVRTLLWPVVSVVEMLV